MAFVFSVHGEGPELSPMDKAAIRHWSQLVAEGEIAKAFTVMAARAESAFLPRWVEENAEAFVYPQSAILYRAAEREGALAAAIGAAWEKTLTQPGAVERLARLQYGDAALGPTTAEGEISRRKMNPMAGMQLPGPPYRKPYMDDVASRLAPRANGLILPGR